MSLPICKFFNSNQTCRFGKQCRFSHTLTQRPPPFSELKSDERDGILSEASAALQATFSTSTEKESALSPQNASDLNNKATEDTPNNTSFKTNRNDLFTQKPICPYFARGWCRYGKSCRFFHNRQYRGSFNDAKGTKIHEKRNLPPRFRDIKKSPATRNVNTEVENLERKNADENKIQPSQGHIQPSSNQSENGNKPSEKLCVYFKAGHCKRGTHCKFSHGDQSNAATTGSCEAPGTKTSDLSTKEKLKETGKKFSEDANRPNRSWSSRQPVQRPFSSRQVFTLAELEEVDCVKVRNGEIEAIKKRFPKDKIVRTNDRGTFVAAIKFVPSDPDWPFDVKEFVLAVEVPPDYPKTTLKVALPLDQGLPATVRRLVEINIQEWIQDRQEQLSRSGKVELVFRPFLRWLDRTIEEITTEALQQLKRELTAKAAGFEFIPAQKLQARFQTVSESSGDDGKGGANSKADDGDDDHDDDDDDSNSDDTEEESEDTSSVEEEEGSDHDSQALELQPQQRGTEVSLRHLQLKEKAAALMFQRLKVILQCGRCKGHTDLYVTQGNVSSLSCNKCSNDMLVTYRPGLLHQFSSVLGYLDVDGCQAFDLVLQDCRASVSCMACNKQTAIDGLVTGQLIDGWCKACNAKFKIATEAVKLTHLVPSGVDTGSAPVVKVASTKAKKPPKDPSIREGYPLPEFGTCKHYKQSYRWLRFPCCGKAYPCDVCHDKKEDHEMTLANRMICGHCCKEQNYSASRPCTGCGEHMTKVRSAHWEGGSGCRDKITMSKGDTQKYKNMNKTVSSKKKESSGPKKKNTKLRHV